jgi:hypothetical protein
MLVILFPVAEACSSRLRSYARQGSGAMLGKVAEPCSARKRSCARQGYGVIFLHKWVYSVQKRRRYQLHCSPPSPRGRR